MNQKNRVDALTIIQWMDETLYTFLHADAKDMPNHRDLHAIVLHRWPYLIKYVKPLYEEIAYVAENFVKELAIRKEQHEDGLISHREYICAVYHEAHLAYEEVKDLHE